MKLVKRIGKGVKQGNNVNIELGAEVEDNAHLGDNVRVLCGAKVERGSYTPRDTFIVPHYRTLDLLRFTRSFTPSSMQVHFLR